jgi:hypothetical protein
MVVWPLLFVAHDQYYSDIPRAFGEQIAFQRSVSDKHPLTQMLGCPHRPKSNINKPPIEKALDPWYAY